MKVAIFCHSLLSDWNHGNAHFLRGVVDRAGIGWPHGAVFEPEGAWSRARLEAEHGAGSISAVLAAYPGLSSTTYEREEATVASLAEGADVVLVHEWNHPDVVRWLGRHKPSGGYRLLFHDTHHRAVSAPERMAAYDLSGYDGVLAFGGAIRAIYLDRGWAERAWTWHEAADVRIFKPLQGVPRQGDLVWIGNWGDGERTAELLEFLVRPVAALSLDANVYGVRYPPEAVAALGEAGISYRGWVANHQVPALFAGHDVTVHVPRRPYVERLPGIPTIRVFEALACGIPLVSAPWDDCEGLFEVGEDFLMAADGDAMKACISEVLADRELADSLAASGLRRIHSRHTCAHRVAELYGICAELGIEVRPA